MMRVTLLATMTTTDKIVTGLFGVFAAFWLIGFVGSTVLVLRRSRHESRLPVDQRKRPRAVVVFEQLHPALKVLFLLLAIAFAILTIIFNK